MAELKQENKMGTMPIGKLVATMAAPMIISMLVQALYNIVDSVFVSRVSQDALSAVSLAFSIQNLMIAVGTGTGVGINAFLSKSLGEKDYKMANKVANHTPYFVGISYLIFLILGLTITNIFFASQTSDQAIISYGVAYTRIVLCCSFGLFGQMLCERLLVSTGRTVLAMASQVTGAVINIILDPIFIFTWGMEIKGAAIATVLGNLLGLMIYLWYYLRRKTILRPSVRLLKLDKEIIKEIMWVGIPHTLEQFFYHGGHDRE